MALVELHSRDEMCRKLISAGGVDPSTVQTAAVGGTRSLLGFWLFAGTCIGVSGFTVAANVSLSWTSAAMLLLIALSIPTWQLLIGQRVVAQTSADVKVLRVAPGGSKATIETTYPIDTVTMDFSPSLIGPQQTLRLQDQNGHELLKLSRCAVLDLAASPA